MLNPGPGPGLKPAPRLHRERNEKRLALGGGGCYNTIVGRENHRQRGGIQAGNDRALQATPANLDNYIQPDRKSTLQEKPQKAARLRKLTTAARVLWCRVKPGKPHTTQRYKKRGITMEAITLLNTIRTLSDVDARRAVVDAVWTADTMILREDWPIALRIRALTYRESDLGADGKLREIEYRLSLCKASAVHWAFFRAHPSTKSDTFRGSRAVEMKTGAGDWYVAEGTYETAIAKICRSTKKLRWETEEFLIVCTYGELCEYLAAFKGKGIEPWFPKSKAADRDGSTLLRLQEWKNSKVKVAYLQACPYNIG